MILRALSNGALSSTGTLTVPSQIVGGVLITTDNTNAATVILRRDNASGSQILDISTITTMWIGAPFSLDRTETVYYSITGTGASAHLYEWVT